jgi:23S rRNA (adenine1618-N6)-methyltransferase
MLRESAASPHQEWWFSSRASTAEHVADDQRQLRKAGARDVRIVAMAQGSKQSRFVAWTFFDADGRDAWRARWTPPGER